MNWLEFNETIFLISNFYIIYLLKIYITPPRGSVVDDLKGD